MDFKQIDAMFEGAMKRLGARASAADPYGESPLASDHFLLKRGWEYFHQRTVAMDAEWKQILNAKEQEIKALRELLRLRDERLGELEGETRNTDKIEEAFVRQQLAEQRDFSDATKKLYDTWEDEREALIRSVEEAAVQVQRVRAEAEYRLKAGEKEIAALRASLDRVRAEVIAQADKRIVADGDASEALLVRDEVVRSMESKLDLLRSELDLRELAIKDLSERTEGFRKEAEESSRRIAADATELSARTERISFLDEKLEAARREMEDLRSAWKREQAEWRELWDRSREMWDRKRNASQFPSEGGEE